MAMRGEVIWLDDVRESFERARACELEALFQDDKTARILRDFAETLRQRARCNALDAQGR